MRTLLPGYPAVMAALKAAEPVHSFGRSDRAPRRACSWGLPRVSTSSCSTRRISTIAPGDPYSGARRRRLARQSAALRRACPRRRRHRPRPPARLDAGHRPCHDWQAGLAPAYLHYAERAAAGDGHDGPQPRLPGPVPGRSPASSACRRAPSLSTASSTTARRLPEGRAAACGPHHHRVAHLCAGDPDARSRHGPRRALASQVVHRQSASSTASTPTSGTPRPTP